MAERSRKPALFTIPSHRAFSDSLAAGLIERHRDDPLALAKGRILLPNSRAVRSMTEAFVRLSGGGLLLPRLVPIGDPELGERLGGALLPPVEDEPPPAIDPGERLLELAAILRATAGGSAEALRLAADLARTLDALGIEEIDPRRLREVVADGEPGAAHWQKSLAQLEAILSAWPAILAARGSIDLVERRNLTLRRLAKRWSAQPPDGFTVAAGITTAAPAIAALLKTVATMAGGEVVIPGLWLVDVLPDEEWDALGCAEGQRDEPAHPQFHLKLLLSRMGMRRSDVEPWGARAGAEAKESRSRAVANAFAAPAHSHKWVTLKPVERRFDGVRLAEFSDPAAEAQGIALALREALESPGKTAALVTPDRGLAERVSALLQRWGIEADDSAGRALSRTPPGTLVLALAALAAEEFAPVALLAALKHPLAGGADEERLRWLDDARSIDLKLRGPRPAAGISGLDKVLGDSDASENWAKVRPSLAALDGLFATPLSLASLAERLAASAQTVSKGRAWLGQAGGMAAELLANLAASPAAERLTVGADDAVPIFRQWLDSAVVRPPFGGHPRLSIRGLLEARLQRADLMILGGLNEGTWPALPTPDAFLPPRVRADLGMPTLETRIGLSAQDFADALNAPQVLVTRAKRDIRSPTVASRFWLRLDAISGGIAREGALEALTRALDDPGPPRPVDRPAPEPPAGQRPTKISVTAVDRLKADPFAFYAQAILKLRAIDPVDADVSPRWKGTAVHQVFQLWLEDDDCAPETLRPRAEALLRDGGIHPMLRALWAPRLMEAIDWIAALEQANRAEGRRPLAAEADGEAVVAGVTVYGRADRIDRLAGGGLAIVDYKTGSPPTLKAVKAGFALQLGLLGLIGRAGGFPDAPGDPVAFEYWSLSRHNSSFGRLMRPDKDMDEGEFLARAYAAFAEAAGKWLTGVEPFTAKLNSAYAPYGDFDQLMRLDEWYGRR